MLGTAARGWGHFFWYRVVGVSTKNNKYTHTRSWIVVRRQGLRTPYAPIDSTLPTGSACAEGPIKEPINFVGFGRARQQHIGFVRESLNRQCPLNAHKCIPEAVCPDIAELITGPVGQGCGCWYLSPGAVLTTSLVHGLDNQELSRRKEVRLTPSGGPSGIFRPCAFCKFLRMFVLALHLLFMTFWLKVI